ncbi:MAG: YadA-like family protein [Moraxella sp.]|nr:YadA-like family protein [Moraxella sp.]
MNKIYRVIWNKSTQTWTAVSEYATAQGKSSSRSSVAGDTPKSLKGMRFVYTALASASLLVLGGQVMAAPITSTNSSSGNSNYCVYDDESQTVICGDETTTSVDTVAGKPAKSVVLGKGATNTGESSVAVGISASSAGTSAVAVGDRAKAAAEQAIAVGQNAQANGQWDVSVGRQAGWNAASPASGEGRNIALGDGALKNGLGVNNNTVMGTSAAANLKGTHNVVIGTYANTEEAIQSAESAGSTETQINAKTRKVAIIDGNTGLSNGEKDVKYIETANSVAIGTRALATKAAGVAVGQQAKAFGTTSAAVGNGSRALGDNAVAMGNTANAGANGAIAIGQQANYQPKVVGTGTDQNPEIPAAYKTTGANSVAIGVRTNATSNHAIAMGTEAKATANGAVAVGSESNTSGVNATAIGQASEAKGKNSFAAGNDAHAVGTSAVAIGDGAGKGTMTTEEYKAGNYANAASGDSSTAVGVYTKAKGEGATAVGVSADAQSHRSVAVGAHSVSSANSAVAIGDTAKAADLNTISIGRQSGSAGVDLANKGTNTANDITGRTKAGKTSANGLVNVTSIGNEAGKGTINNNYGVNIGYQAGSGGYNSTYGEGVSIGNKTGGVDKTNATVKTAMQAFSAGQGATDNAIITGNTNTAISSRAGVNALGHDNVAIGKDAGGYSSGNSNIAIGRHAGRASKLNTPNNEATRMIDGEVFSTARNTISMGEWAHASGNDAVAIGRLAQAPVEDSIAIGRGVKTELLAGDGVGDREGMIAIGSNTTKATGKAAISIGRNAQGIGRGTVALGDASQANAGQGIAVGAQANVASAAAGGIAIGSLAKSEKHVAIAVGSEAQAKGDKSVAVGSKAIVDSAKGVAVGYGAKAEGAETANIAIGDSAYTNASGALAIGIGASAKGLDVVTTNNQGVPTNDKAKPYNAIAIGTGANVDTLAAGANGVQERSTDAIAIGTNAKANYASTIAIGYGAKANTKSSATAIGLNSDAKGWKSLAVGVSAVAKQTDSVALGSDSVADTGINQIGADPLNAQTDKNNHTWKSTKAAVSVGNVAGGVTRQITSVAAGTQDTDAVNVAQLKAAGFIVNTTNTANGELGAKTVGTTKDDDDKVQNGETLTIEADKNIKVTQTGAKVTIATKDDVEFSTVTTKDNAGNQTLLNGTGLTITPTGGNNPVSLTSTGLNNGGHKILGVADGNIAQGSTNAVNGGQLFTTNTKVDTNTANIAKGLNFAGNTGEFKRELGDKVTISGGLADGKSASNSNIRTVADNGKIDIQIADAPVFTGVVKGHGFDASGQKITNVAQGDSANDAVNVAQLEKAINDVKVQSLTKVESNSPFSYINSNGDLLKRDIDSDDSVKYYKVSDGTEYTPTSDDDITITALNPKKSQTSVSVKVGNVSAGTDDEDAVNVSQLKDVVKALGGSAAVDGSGNITQPSYKVAGNTFNTVGAAIEKLDKEVANPLKFVGDNAGEKVERKLNEELKVKGGADQTKLSENNIGVVGNVNDKSLTIKLAKDVDLGADGSLTAGDSKVNNDGLTITKSGKQPVSLTSDGLNNGGNVISNVASNLPATTYNSATQGNPSNATKAQSKPADLDGKKTNAATVGDVLNAGWNVQTNGNDTDFVKPYDTVNFADGDGTSVSSETDGDKTTFKVNVLTPVVYTDENGNKLYKQADGSFRTQPNGGGDLVDPPNVIASMHGPTGLTNQPVKLANVAAGVANTDAVNVKQLADAGIYETEQNGDVKLDNNGVPKLKGLNFAGNDGTGNSKLGETWKIVGGNAAANAGDPRTFVDGTFSGGNIKTAVKDGAVEITMADSPKFGDIVINAPAVTDTANPTNNRPAGRITGLADGVDDKDAVTVKQLKDKTATTPLTVTNNKVVDLADTDKSKLATAGDIANAINNAGFTLTTAKTNNGELGANATNELIKAGDSVTVEADNNIKLTQADGKITIATKKDVKFDSVTVGEGDNQVVLNNDGVKSGDTTVNNAGITIKAPATSGTSDVKLTANGLNNGGNKITNVAKGTADTDAVNVSQLKDLKTTTDGKLAAFTVGTDKNATAQGITVDKDKARFDIVGADDGKVITQVDGNKIAVDLTADAKDSLAKADSALQSIQVKANGTDVTTLGKDNNTLDITQGDNITVSNDGGKVKVALNQDVAGLNSLTSKTITAGEGTNQVILGNDGVKVGGNTYISGTGLNANNKKVANVADGAITATSKDAVNGSQLFATNQNVTNNANAITGLQNQTFKLQANGDTATAVKASDTVQFLDGDNIVVTRKANDITITTKKDVKFDSVVAAGTKLDSAGLSFVDGAGATVANSPSIAKTGINAGGNKITGVAKGTADTDAVNVSQLKGVATALGGGASINADGTINAPTYNITNPADGAVIKAQNVGDALNALNTAVNNPLTFAADTGSFDRKLGQTTTIKGGVADTSKLSDNNIGVVAKDGALDIKLAKDIAVDSVATGNTTVNSDGIVIKAPATGGTTDVKLTATGLNNGGNKITNVADGEVVAGSKDAVNGGQLFKVKQEVASNTANIAKGLSFAGNTGEFNSQLGDKVTVSGGLNDTSITSSNANIRTLAKDGKIDVQIADAPVFAGKVSAKGLDAGNQKITGVANGENATDAVNVDQLSKALGNVTVQNQSLVQANSPFSYVNEAGEQLIRKVAVVNGKSVVTFEKAKDGSVYTGDDISIVALNPKAPQTTLPTTVGNIKAGVKDTDAVNVSQLKAVEAKAEIKTKVTQGDGVAVINKGTAEAPNYEVALNQDSKDSLTKANSALQTIKVKANGADVKELTKDSNELNIKGDDNVKVSNDNGDVKVGLADVVTVGAPTNATGTANNPVKIDGEKGSITGLTNKDLSAADFAKAGRAASEEQLKVVDDFAVKYDKDQAGQPNKDSITLAGTPATPALKGNDDKFTMAGGTALNNVASAGDYTKPENAYKAVNAGDLNNAVADVANKGLSFAANDQSKTANAAIKRSLGETVGIKGGITDNATATSGENVITRTTADGNINIELAKNAKFDSLTTGGTKIDNAGLRFVDSAGATVANSPSIAKTGINAGNQKITGVANGENATDAVNVDQLSKALGNVTVQNQSLVQANSPFSYINEAGEQLIREVKVVNGKNEVAFKKAKDGTTYTGKDITIAALNPVDPQTTLPTTVGNIKAGVKDTDAVNVSQLKGTVAALGGGATINADGTIWQPNYTVTGNVYNNVGDAVQALNSEVAKPLTFIDDNGKKVARKLGENITVKGGATGNLTKNNIGVVANPTTGELNVQLAEAVNLGQNGSVAMGNSVVNGTGLTIKSPTATNPNNVVSVTANGLNNGGNKIIGVAKGVADTDAVNVSQLKAVEAKAEIKTKVTQGDGVAVINKGTTEAPNYEVALNQATKNNIAQGIAAKNAVDNKGLTFTGDSGTTGVKKLGDAVAITGDKNITTTATAAGVQVALNDTILVNSAEIGGVTVNNTGINMGDKQITGLASGLNGKTLDDIKTDPNAAERSNAATVGDLATVQSNVTNITNNVLGGNYVDDDGELTANGKLALKTYDVSGQEGTTDNTIISAIKNMNEGGIKYFHTNDGTNKPAGAKDNNTEDSNASGAYATAVGFRANAEGENALAFGKGSQALAKNAIAIGTGNIVRGENSGAIGDPSIINGSNSYSVGNNNTVATNSTFVLGNDVSQTVDNSVFLGDKSSSTGVHTIAQGGNYTYAGANDANVAGVVGDTAPVGVVSVGSEGGQTRQIQNVAAGVVSPSSTDAINGSQLYDTHQVINNVSNHVVNMGNQLNQRIGDVEDKANAGVSSAMAMASLPQAYIPGKSMLTGGLATYNGEGAVAVGLSKLSDNGRWVLKMSGSADTKGNAGASIGAGFHF